MQRPSGRKETILGGVIIQNVRMIDGLFCKYFLLNRNILILLSLLDRAISEKRSRLNREKGSELLNAAVDNSIIRLARDYYKSRFEAEQVSDIKSVINLFGDDKRSHQAAGDFLYITATQKGLSIRR